MKYTLFKISSILFLLLSFQVQANDLTITTTTSTGYTFNILQDGQNNNIDYDMLDMDGSTTTFNQTGNNNSIDVDVDGRTSNGSTITINQTGDNKSYSNSLWCGHTYCTMTVNQ